jgi:hypothetical protein
MRFQVPQFTDVEDKIFGSLTFKQFIYLAGSAGACVILFYLIPYRFVAILFMLPIAAFGLALAFYKVNNKPFIRVVEAFFKYAVTNKLYIWKHEPRKITPGSQQKELSGSLLPKLGDSRLKDITWNLDVSENPNAAKK